MTPNTIKCELCGLICSMQISASHLRAAHSMTTKEYRALGYQTLSQARLDQLRDSPVAKGICEVRYGKDHHNWKGGYISHSGYKVLSIRGVEVYEHRLVAEQMISRPLERDEVVHHIDGNRTNNSPENLVVMKRQEHDKIKVKTKQYFHTGPDCEEAAKALHDHGWSISKIARALRVEPATISAWIKLTIHR